MRRIEERHQAATRVEGVFSLELVTLRARLRDLTAKLVTADRVTLGTKAMEVYWRRAYHEPIALARALREGEGGARAPRELTRAELALVEAHLAAGVGHYTSTLTTLVRRSSWTPPLALDFGPSAISAYGFSEGGGARTGRGEEGEAAWTEGAVVRCLVCLGDLGRYQTELCGAPASLPARCCTCTCTPGHWSRGVRACEPHSRDSRVH